MPILYTQLKSALIKINLILCNAQDSFAVNMYIILHLAYTIWYLFSII